MQKEDLLPDAPQEWGRLFFKDGETYAPTFPIPDNFRPGLLRARRCLDDFQQTHDAEALREVVAAWEDVCRHPDFPAARPEFRLAALTSAAEVSLAFTTFTHDPAHLHLAVECYGKASKLTTPGSAEWVGVLHELASALCLRHELTRDLDDLKESLRVWERAFPSARSKLGIGDEVQVKLGRALSIYHTRRKSADVSFTTEFVIDSDEHRAEVLRRMEAASKDTHELEHSISLLEDAFGRLRPDSPLYFECLLYLGDALSFAYGTDSNVAYLDRAVEMLEEGLSHPAPADSFFAPYVLVNLGAKLLLRYQKSRSLSDLDRGIEAMEEFYHRSPDEELFDCKFFMQLADALLERYDRKKEFTDLEKAIGVYRLAVAAPPGELPAYRSQALDGYACALKRLYEVSGNPADLDAAIEAWEQAIAHEGPFLFSHFGRQAAALEERFLRTGDLSDITRAIEATRRATDEDALGLGEMSYQNFLAQRLMRRYERTRDIEDLQESIRLLEQALDKHKVSDVARSTLMHNLGRALKTRFEVFGDVADYERATQLGTAAADLIPADSPWQSDRLRNVATLHFEEYDQTGDLSYLRSCVEAMEQALRLVGEDAPEFADYVSNFGLFLSSLGDETGDVEVIDRAIATLRKAAELMPRSAQNFTDTLSHLSGALIGRYDLTRHTPDIDEAIQWGTRVVSLTPDGATNLPRRLFNLAQAYKRRYDNLKDEEDIARAVGFYKRAALDGVVVEIEVALKSARFWGDYALRRASWGDAIEAYSLAQEASEKLFQIQLVRRSKESWLTYTQGLTAHLAYALARTGDLSTAVMILERGAARLLSESSEYSRADLSGLRDGGRAELYERYLEAETNWNHLVRLEQLHDPGGIKGIVPTGALQAARAGLDSLIQEIREVPGYESFHRSFDFPDVQRACGDDPVVYIAVTTVGALALVVARAAEAGVLPLWLPELTEDSLADILQGAGGPHAASDGYLAAYSEWSESGDAASLERWRAALDRATGWLWEVLMGRLTHALGGAKRAHLIPTGMLAVLPLHAAWVADAESPTGLRYALDKIAFAYVPNSRSLGKARSIAASVRHEAILAIAEPQPVKAALLPNAAYEVQAAVETFRDARVLRRGEATRARVLALLPDYTVLHFACHSRADLVEPSRTSMIMAYDESISVADLLGLRLRGIRLAVLSSCETGLPGIRLADEMFSLSAGLLQASVAGVVASLWQVKDVSTIMLMFVFYHTWREGRKEPVAALREAQLWMRDSTNREKADYFKSFLPEFGGHGRYEAVASHLYRTAALLTKAGRDFAHPYDWAAFCYFGV